MEGLEQVFGSSFNSGDRQVNKPTKELGQEDFFRLMVAQLNNQDPTKPLDNTEFLGQLAQFSTVSGIEELGSSFEGLVSNLFASQAMMAAQLIDREVLVGAGATLNTFYDGGDGVLEGGFVSQDVTSDTRINIYDGAGVLVNSIIMGTVEPGSHQFTWNGTTRDGSQAEAGRYFIQAEGYVNGQVNSLPMQQYSLVNSVSVDRKNTEVLLHLNNGDSVTFSQINEFK